jgi:tRNA uridine 5-carbamoylmethylation protein Kti12
MMCFTGTRGSGDTTRSQDIDRIIRKDGVRMANEVKILLLGESLSLHVSSKSAAWQLGDVI